ncbi:RloB domain-containing protein [Clostridium sp. Marseille-P2415]|uniref:RloB domain-containing protein n=1 Tax=Clostridium sp. Marseille-P2415 TaxID=1805471 RepID=UPI0009886543|nr:RloB domain-containing protein [Clostridium sp. Marseille-P2415]
MVLRKSTKKYYFSVEGETEQWYLIWLQDRINKTEKAAFKVSFDCPVQKNPLKRAKSLVVIGKTEIYHLSDYESDERVHVQGFQDTMDNMKKAKELGKQIDYRFGYSNLTFDLWIILHKTDCYGSFTHRKHYLAPLNRAYGEHFESMDEYKHEDNFKRVLGKLQLSDVCDAVNRAKAIMKKNHENGYILHQYKGYRYYKENPSLAIWEAIEKILKDCKL